MSQPATGELSDSGPAARVGSRPRRSRTPSFGRVTKVLSAVFGTLSLVMLVKHGFATSFVSSLELMLHYYEAAAQALFGWAEPWIQQQLVAVREWIGVELQLYPHWKHVFVLMGMYYFRDIVNFLNNADVAGALLLGSLGMVVSLGSSIGAGVVPLAGDDFASNFLVVAAPLTGQLLYGSTRSAWATAFYREGPTAGEDYRRRLFSVWRDVAVGFVILGGLLQVPFIRNLTSPALAILGIIMFCFAIWHLRKGWVRSGAQYAAAAKREANLTRSEAFWEHGNTIMGLGMFVIFLGATFFVGVNAGLKLLGVDL